MGVDKEFNESSTATSGQDAALCGHQTARQYSFQPPFQTSFRGLSLINSAGEESAGTSSGVSLSGCFHGISVPLPSGVYFYFPFIKRKHFHTSDKRVMLPKKSFNNIKTLSLMRIKIQALSRKVRIDYDKITVPSSISTSRQLVNGAVKLPREEGQWIQ